MGWVEISHVINVVLFHVIVDDINAFVIITSLLFIRKKTREFVAKSKNLDFFFSVFSARDTAWFR